MGSFSVSSTITNQFSLSCHIWASRLIYGENSFADVIKKVALSETDAPLVSLIVLEDVVGSPSIRIRNRTGMLILSSNLKFHSWVLKEINEKDIYHTIGLSVRNT